MWHDHSLLYLVCTDWRVTPKASPICCHDQPFSRADATLLRFDPLCQAVEGQRGPEPDRRVVRREIRAELLDVHDCQFRLTCRGVNLN